MSTTEDRIENLENQVRRQRRWNIALGAVVVVGGLMAATGVRSVPDVIQAKKFEVVNDEGVAVVKLESSQGYGVIVSHDKKGVPTFVVAHKVGEDGVSVGWVETRSGKGGKLVELGATVEGQGLVETQNGKGGTLVRIGMTTRGEGLVETQNGKGGRLVGLGATTGGQGAVFTENGKGGRLVQLSSTTDGGGLVETQNGKGGTLVELSRTTGGYGVVKTQNGKGGTLVELGATTDGEGFVETQNGKGQRLVELGTNQMGGTVICTNAIGKNVAMIGARQEDGSGVVLTTDPAGKEFTSTNPSP